jgi:hypothetical protein
LNPSTSKKGVQYLFGKKNCVWRFVPDYANIVNPINLLLKKDQKFECNHEIQATVTRIKHAIIISLVLVNTKFDQDFIIYYFASKETIASIFSQRNLKGGELPISSMSKTFHDYELRYSEIDKHTLSLVKVVAHFRTYILSSHVIAYVPTSLVKMLLNQQFREGKLASWLAKIQEYDIEIKPLKTIRG